MKFLSRIKLTPLSFLLDNGGANIKYIFISPLEVSNHFIAYLHLEKTQMGYAYRSPFLPSIQWEQYRFLPTESREISHRLQNTSGK